MAKVLVIGSGGREHALGWIIGEDKDVTEVLYGPGNAGTEKEKHGRNVSLNATKEENFPAVMALIEKESIDMVVVGPEAPLDKGLVDFLNERGYNMVVGPSRLATKIEADKFYSFDVMGMSGIPQAEGIRCYSTADAESAIRSLATKDGVVIKARGLTEGKGVTVCDSLDQALAEINNHAKKYGSEVLISQRLLGEEFSMFGISDGNMVKCIKMMFQDHKPLLKGDKGPNTGGMGAYGPASLSNSDALILQTEGIMTSVVQEMKRRGHDYKGFLYAGMMLTKEGPKVIECNARFGDPECQPAMMMLDPAIGLYAPLSLALQCKLDQISMKFRPGASLCAVLASNGYPLAYEKGLLIGGLDEASEMPGVKIFHAGTGKDSEGRIITTGGRVLGVTAYAESGIRDAYERAYAALRIIDDASTRLNNKRIFINRDDVGRKELERAS